MLDAGKLILRVALRGSFPPPNTRVTSTQAHWPTAQCMAAEHGRWRGAKAVVVPVTA